MQTEAESERKDHNFKIANCNYITPPKLSPICVTNDFG